MVKAHIISYICDCNDLTQVELFSRASSNHVEVEQAIARARDVEGVLPAT